MYQSHFLKWFNRNDCVFWPCFLPHQLLFSCSSRFCIRLSRQHSRGDFLQVPRGHEKLAKFDLIRDHACQDLMVRMQLWHTRRQQRQKQTRLCTNHIMSFTTVYILTHEAAKILLHVKILSGLKNRWITLGQLWWHLVFGNPEVAKTRKSHLNYWIYDRCLEFERFRANASFHDRSNAIDN